MKLIIKQCYNGNEKQMDISGKDVVDHSYKFSIEVRWKKTVMSALCSNLVSPMLFFVAMSLQQQPISFTEGTETDRNLIWMISEEMLKTW